MTYTPCARGCTSGHLDGCQDAGCAGCRPRPAAVGLQVCARDETGAREALRALPGVWDDVVDAGVLRAPTGGSGGQGRPIPLDVDGAAWRLRVRVCLIGWLRVLEEEFGLCLDDAVDDVSWMVHRVAVQAGRLLASEHADQLCADLLGWVEEDGPAHQGLLSEGRRLAFRSRGSRQRIRCMCGGWVSIETDTDGRIDTEAVLACRLCREFGVIGWWQTRVVGDQPRPMTLRELPDWLALVHGLQVTSQRLRTWADEGALRALSGPVPAQEERRGPGRPPRRYDPVEVAAVVLEMTARRRTA